MSLSSKAQGTALTMAHVCRAEHFLRPAPQPSPAELLNMLVLELTHQLSRVPLVPILEHEPMAVTIPQDTTGEFPPGTWRAINGRSFRHVG